MSVVCTSGGGGLFGGGTGGTHGRRRLLVQVSQTHYTHPLPATLAIRVIVWGVRRVCAPPLSKDGGRGTVPPLLSATRGHFDLKCVGGGPRWRAYSTSLGRLARLRALLLKGRGGEGKGSGTPTFWQKVTPLTVALGQLSLESLQGRLIEYQLRLG